MGADRNLRRLARKPGHAAAGLTEALNGLQKVQALGATAEAVGEKLQEAQALVDELALLKGALHEAIDICRVYDRQAAEMLERERELLLELQRQRAVFLRLLFYNNDMLLSADSSDPNRYMGIEERYRAEYNGMVFMMWLAEFVGPGRAP